MPRVRRTVVILISGKAGAGKTTVKEILSEKILGVPSMTVFPYSFANPLKYIANAYFGWDKEKDEKGRRLLQDLGRVGREYNENILVKHFLTQLDRNKDNIFPPCFAVIDDWRFPNELNYIKKNPLLDVITIRIFGRQADLPGGTASEVSENSLPEVSVEVIPNHIEGDHWYDFQIDNGCELDILNHKLDLVLAEIEKQYIVEE